MDLDEELCLCFHVTQRKVINFIRVEKPRRAGQLSECFGAGTGCGWCRPFLERLFRELQQGADAAELPLRAEYAQQRAAYVRAGGGINHRTGLYDGVLIKDNHLAIRSPNHVGETVAELIREARGRVSPEIPIQVEVESLDYLFSQRVQLGPGHMHRAHQVQHPVSLAYFPNKTLGLGRPGQEQQQPQDP